MSQTPEEQANLSTWSDIAEDVARLVRATDGSVAVAALTASIAKSRGYSAEVVMDALLEGVQQGVLAMEEDRVSLRDRGGPGIAS